MIVDTYRNEEFYNSHKDVTVVVNTGNMYVLPPPPEGYVWVDRRVLFPIDCRFRLLLLAHVEHSTRRKNGVTLFGERRRQRSYPPSAVMFSPSRVRLY